MQFNITRPRTGEIPANQATVKRRSDRIHKHLANERTYLAQMRSAILLADSRG